MSIKSTAVIRETWVATYLVSRGVSIWGSRLTFLALPAAATAAAPDGGAFVAVMEGMTVVGFVAFAVAAGVLADRYQPVHTMIVADLLRATTTSLAAFSLVRLVTTWSATTAVVAAAATAVSSCAGTAYEAAAQRLIVERARPDQRVHVNAWVQGLSSAAQLLTPVVVGLLVATVGAAIGLYLDAATYVAAAVLLWACRAALLVSSTRLSPIPDRAAGTKSAGFAVLRSMPMLRAATTSVALANFFAGVYGATYVFYVLTDLGLGGSGLAIIGAAAAAGGLLGAVSASRVIARWSHLGVLTAGPFGYASLFLVVLAAPGDVAGPAIGAALYSFVSALVAIAYVSFRQSVTPSGAAGRVAAATGAVTNGVYPLSALTAVVGLTVLSAHTMVTMSVVGEVASAAVLLRQWSASKAGART